MKLYMKEKCDDKRVSNDILLRPPTRTSCKNAIYKAFWLGIEPATLDY